MRSPRNQLNFINRGDQSSGLVILLFGMLAYNVWTQGFNSLPPREQILGMLGSFVIAITVHEFMHAYVAWRLGDSTAKDLGRITLNPVSHFDPFGFFGMVMISIGQPFFGWGRPVPVNPNRLRGRGIAEKKRSMGLVAVAGPLSNVSMASIAAVILWLSEPVRVKMFGTVVDVGGLSLISLGGAWQYVWYFFIVNVLLASFNMIPIPPLDGHKILTALVPSFWYPVLAPMERYGFIIIFGLFFLSGALHAESITDEMISPVRDLLLRILI